MAKQIRLNLIFHTSGRHDAGWKAFEDPSILVDDIDHQVGLAQRAEEALFDAIFLPDTPEVLNPNFLRKPRRGLEPTVLLAAIARETNHLGLISTQMTQIGYPYLVARSIATLQHVSKGRAGWNIVTSQDDAAFLAMGLPIERLDRTERYEKASEFVEIVLAHWDSLPREAIVADKEGDIYIDKALTHPVKFEGKYLKSEGVLQLTGRYKGDRPVLFQAGVSPQSRAFGAKYADALFTSQPDIEHDRKFYAEAKALATSYGRNPDDLVVLPGLYTVVGESEADARKRKAEYDELMEAEFLVNNLAKSLGIPADKLDLNKELPYSLFEEHPTDDEVIRYRRENIGGVSRANKFTVKQLVHHNLTRGQRAIFGTPEQIADTIIEWRDSGVSDGFNVNIDVQPDGLDRFRDVISVLQDRGRFRKEYEHDNFRKNYGLPTSAEY